MTGWRIGSVLGRTDFAALGAIVIASSLPRSEY
jgi:hypothetical protein